MRAFYGFRRFFVVLALLGTAVVVLVGCQAARQPQPLPTQQPKQVQTVEGVLVAIGSNMVIMTDDKEVTLPVSEDWNLTRDGQPMNGLELRANVRVRAQVRDGKIVQMDVLTAP